MGFRLRDNPTKTATAEPESLVLDFQRLTVRLVQAGAISRKLSARLVQVVSRSSLVGEELHRRLCQLLVGVLAGVEDGTLEQGVHVLRLDGGRLALHLESVGPALFRAQRCTLLTSELRRVCRFGWQHFRDVVVANSERVTFGPEEDRRRAVILDVARAQEFVEKHQAAVPLGRERPRF